MDIKAKITEIVDKVKNDGELKKKFTADPKGAVRDLIGVDLPDDTVSQIVEGVKGKLSLDKASDVLGSLKKKLF